MSAKKEMGTRFMGPAGTRDLALNGPRAPPRAIVILANAKTMGRAKISALHINLYPFSASHELIRHRVKPIKPKISFGTRVRVHSRQNARERKACSDY
jgi:hypothetical protein